MKHSNLCEKLPQYEAILNGCTDLKNHYILKTIIIKCKMLLDLCIFKRILFFKFDSTTHDYSRHRKFFNLFYRRHEKYQGMGHTQSVIPLTFV